MLQSMYLINANIFFVGNFETNFVTVHNVLIIPNALHTTLHFTAYVINLFTLHAIIILILVFKRLALL